MKVILILLSLLLSGCTTNTVNGIKSQVSIIDRVDPHSLKVNQGRFYAVRIELINGTDTTLNFWTMSCSWQDNWVIEDKALSFFVNCPKNTPKMIQLKSNTKITYDGIIELLDTINFSTSKNLRLGFVLIKKNEVHRDDEFKNILFQKIDAKKDIIWSEPFKVDK